MELLSVLGLGAVVIGAFYVLVYVGCWVAAKAIFREPSKITEKKLNDELTIYQYQDTETAFLFKEIWTDDAYGARTGLTLQPGAVVVDCGANIGMFALWALHNCGGNATVHAFEPIPKTFEALRRNAERVGRDRLHPVNAGLSDTTGTVTFEHHANCSIWSTLDRNMAEQRIKRSAEEFATSLHASPLGYFAPLWLLRRAMLRTMRHASRMVKVEAKLITLSDYFDEQNITRVDLLKVDVEGAEVQVLRGIREEHWPMVQQVALEVETADLRDECASILLSAGFHVRCDRTNYGGSSESVLSMLYASRDRSRLDEATRRAAAAAAAAGGDVTVPLSELLKSIRSRGLKLPASIAAEEPCPAVPEKSFEGPPGVVRRHAGAS